MQHERHHVGHLPFQNDRFDGRHWFDVTIVEQSQEHGESQGSGFSDTGLSDVKFYWYGVKLSSCHPLKLPRGDAKLVGIMWTWTDRIFCKQENVTNVKTTKRPNQHLSKRATPTVLNSMNSPLTKLIVPSSHLWKKLPERSKTICQCLFR